MDERSRIAMLARIFAPPGGAWPPARGVPFAIGDDAAVLDPSRVEPQLVWTIDEQVEGTHFRRDLASWRQIGWRSFMAAASDLAAMGARPWCALSALVLPDSLDDPAFSDLAVGQREASQTVGAPIVGGNLARGAGALSIATTLLGSCPRAVTRAGACVGDALWLAGEVGLAAAGLRALVAGRTDDPRLAPAIEAWRSPRALIDQGLAMGSRAHAAVDVSDGLAVDAARIGEASGNRIVLDELALMESMNLRRAAEALGADGLELALYGGEDYALVVAAPGWPGDGFRAIGVVCSGAGLGLRGAAGERSIEPRGYDHFARGT